jgi:choline transport protein
VEVNIIGSVNLRLQITKSLSVLLPVCVTLFFEYSTKLRQRSGWMSSLGWVASVTSSAFVVTTQLQAMIDVTHPDYAFTHWQYTLIMLAFLVVTIFFNTWGAKTLPMVEIVSLFGHVAGFIITIIPLWVLCSKNSATTVFIEVVNNGGWSNTGTACLVSQVTIMYCNLGSDSVVHICEFFHGLGLIIRTDCPSSRRSRKCVSQRSSSHVVELSL